MEEHIETVFYNDYFCDNMDKFGQKVKFVKSHICNCFCYTKCYPILKERSKVFVCPYIVGFLSVFDLSLLSEEQILKLIDDEFVCKHNAERLICQKKQL